MNYQSVVYQVCHIKYSSLNGLRTVLRQLVHCQAMIAYDILSFNLHALNAELGPNFFAETSSDTKA